MTQTHWRLAFMFDALSGDLDRLAEQLGVACESIEAAAQGNRVRMGVAIREASDLDAETAHAMADWRTVDGAVEVSIANGGEGAVPDICKAMRPILDGIAKQGSVEVMTGAMHYMVPVREGDVFLSLSFRRGEGTIVDEFRKWWYGQHAPLCIPILGPGLLAYDQVHVDEQASREAAEALGVAYVDNDAYDNLTWGDQDAYVQSTTGDPEGMGRIAEDEVGRIDNNTRRHALMREIR
ncbi:MAG: EthD domain-containing protein [Novosphingobium sp.]|nr:EthD domain-containing protein [Novosphingobium sp.]